MFFGPVTGLSNAPGQTSPVDQFRAMMARAYPQLANGGQSQESSVASLGFMAPGQSFPGLPTPGPLSQYQLPLVEGTGAAGQSESLTGQIQAGGRGGSSPAATSIGQGMASPVVSPFAPDLSTPNAGGGVGLGGGGAEAAGGGDTGGVTVPLAPVAQLAYQGYKTLTTPSGAPQTSSSGLGYGEALTANPAFGAITPSQYQNIQGVLGSPTQAELSGSQALTAADLRRLNELYGNQPINLATSALPRGPIAVTPADYGTAATAEQGPTGEATGGGWSSMLGPALQLAAAGGSAVDPNLGRAIQVGQGAYNLYQGASNLTNAPSAGAALGPAGSILGIGSQLLSLFPETSEAGRGVGTLSGPITTGAGIVGAEAAQAAGTLTPLAGTMAGLSIVSPFFAPAIGEYLTNLFSGPNVYDAPRSAAGGFLTTQAPELLQALAGARTPQEQAAVLDTIRQSAGGSHVQLDPATGAFSGGYEIGEQLTPGLSRQLQDIMNAKQSLFNAAGTDPQAQALLNQLYQNTQAWSQQRLNELAASGIGDLFYGRTLPLRFALEAMGLSGTPAGYQPFTDESGFPYLQSRPTLPEGVGAGYGAV